MDNKAAVLSTLADEIAQCTACPRLVQYCRVMADTKVKRFRDQPYWGRAVPGFGDHDPSLLLVGLAPAAHGANRTGRMFTGDDSGNWLYEALHRYGFANRPTASHRDDGLILHGAYITAAVHCAPPENKPTRTELATCRSHLERELRLLTNVRVVVPLGRIAFDSYVQAVRNLGYDAGRPTFGHNLLQRLPDPALPYLLPSYHPSRQNTQTGRLTRQMWHGIFARARELLGPEA